MAKNVMQKRKRIAHYQRLGNFSGGENDYVSSIIQSMDSNFSSIQFSIARDHSETVAVSKKQRDNDSEPPNKCIPQNSKKTTKFATERKFPLMEKSQKILKQLKHNRKMPKPRAHMARSPVKRSTNCNSPIMSNVKKKKEALEQKRNVISSSFSRNSSTSSSVNTKEVKLRDDPKLPKNVLLKNYELENFKVNNSQLNSVDKKVNIANVKTKVPKTLSKSATSGSDTITCKSTPAENNILTNSNILEDSEGNTTDSEYERFVKHSKKSLKKKISKKQQSPTKRKAHPKKSKRKSPRMDLLEQSDTCKIYDVASKPLSSTLENTLSGAKPKILNEALHDTGNVESESDAMLDVYTRDSSESEMEENISPVTKTLSTVDEASSMQHNVDSLKEPIASDVTMPILDSSANDCVNNFISNCNTTISSSVNNSPKHAKEITIDNSLLIDLCDSDDCDDAILSTASENSAAEIKLANATENSAIIQNVIHPSSEDSDIEVMEVITKKEKCVTAFDNAHNPKNIVIKTEKCLVTEKSLHVDTEFSPVIIKTEGNIFRTRNISEAVYTTNICTDVHETKPAEQSVLNENAIINECSRAIKKEKDPDEVTVLETFESNSTEFVSCKIPSTEDEKIKSEPSNDPKENIQKVCKEIYCTNKESGPSESKLDVSKYIRMNTVDLLELYKREFEIYREMKRAEANVEASLKNLQIHQAEKVQYIRSLFNKYIPSKESSVDKPHTLSLVNKSEDIKPSHFIPSLCPQDSTVNDIKPDVNKLNESQVGLEEQQITVRTKLEPGTVQESSSSKSETDVIQEIPEEKCNVCGKEAIAACQRCAKVFFCSHECGKKFWIEGHENECGN